MSATRHWTALDDTFSRVLRVPGMRHARERFAHRAAALSDIYLARILKAIAEPASDRTDVSGQIDQLRLTHHELAAALTRAWTGDRDQEARTVEAD